MGAQADPEVYHWASRSITGSAERREASCCHRAAPGTLFDHRVLSCKIVISHVDHLMLEEEMMSVQIQDATLDDADGVRQVQQRTWLATYPNAELGITREDIEARFHTASEEAIRRRQAQQQAINSDPLVHMWVAREAERIVGFCLAKKE